MLKNLSIKLIYKFTDQWPILRLLIAYSSLVFNISVSVNRYSSNATLFSFFILFLNSFLFVVFNTWAMFWICSSRSSYKLDTVYPASPSPLRMVTYDFIVAIAASYASIFLWRSSTDYSTSDEDMLSLKAVSEVIGVIVLSLEWLAMFFSNC